MIEEINHNALSYIKKRVKVDSFFQNNIFKQSQRLEELKSQMNWDQQTLEAWLEESLRKEEDAQIVQKYTRYDEAKVKVDEYK